MVVRVAALAFVVLSFCPPAFAAFSRLPVPGGSSALRRVTEMPPSVTDDMLLVEFVRATYGGRDPSAAPLFQQRLLGHLRSSSEAMADGPVLPLTPGVWEWLLECGRPCNLAAALVANRRAMLLYHGLVATDDTTLEWMADHPQLLWELLRGGAEAFASTGPFVHIRDGTVVVPGGAGTRAAWEAAVGTPVSSPEPFIRELMRRNAGRIAWLYSVLAQLDPPHLQFALRGAHGEPALAALLRYAVSSAPEWQLQDRPFWRTVFDFTVVLAAVDLGRDASPRGSPGFWRLVFRSDDLERWDRESRAPLTAEALLGILFDEPQQARERWEIFSLGQRLPGVDADSPDAGRMLRGARRHPALGQMLDRIGIASAAIVLPLHRAAARVFERDETGARGVLGAWQGALAIIERAVLSGGLDLSGAETWLGRLAALKLENPRAELSAWFMEVITSCAARTGAPQDAERLVLQVISGALTPSGPRRTPSFAWEDLTYSLGGADSLVTRIEQVRAAQGAASLEDARVAWQMGAGGPTDSAQALVTRLQDATSPAGAADIARRIDRARGRRDPSELRREARRAAEAIIMAALPTLPYAPHLAVTDTPTLGADVAFRHQFIASDDGPLARRQRPWQLARGQVVAGGGWNLRGSLLMLDLAVADWYLRRHGEPAAVQPMFDDGDMAALAQVAALARSGGSSALQLPEAAMAVEKGRQAAAAFSSMRELDMRLAEAGVDPWRRRSIATAAADPARAAARLSYGEAWRLGGAPGSLSPHPPIDGGAHFGAVVHSPLLMQGRRGAGLVGASAIDAQLRVAVFLHARQLPMALFGDVAAGALSDLIESTPAARPDDLGAFAEAAMRLDDARMEEHLLALVADGTLARPSDQIE